MSTLIDPRTRNASSGATEKPDEPSRDTPTEPSLDDDIDELPLTDHEEPTSPVTAAGTPKVTGVTTAAPKESDPSASNEGDDPESKETAATQPLSVREANDYEIVISERDIIQPELPDIPFGEEGSLEAGQPQSLTAVIGKLQSLNQDGRTTFQLEKAFAELMKQLSSDQYYLVLQIHDVIETKTSIDVYYSLIPQGSMVTATRQPSLEWPRTRENLAEASHLNKNQHLLLIGSPAFTERKSYGIPVSRPKSGVVYLGEKPIVSKLPDNALIKNSFGQVVCAPEFLDTVIQRFNDYQQNALEGHYNGKRRHGRVRNRGRSNAAAVSHFGTVMLLHRLHHSLFNPYR